MKKMHVFRKKADFFRKKMTKISHKINNPDAERGVLTPPHE